MLKHVEMESKFTEQEIADMNKMNNDLSGFMHELTPWDEEHFKFREK